MRNPVSTVLWILLIVQSGTSLAQQSTVRDDKLPSGRQTVTADTLALHMSSAVDSLVSKERESVAVLKKILQKIDTTASPARDSSSSGLDDVRLSLGRNFDFVNGLRADDVYADIDAFFPNAFGDSSRIGIEAGFIQSLSFTKDSTLTKLPQWVNGTLQGTDTVVAAVPSLITSVKSINLILFADITVRVCPSLFLVGHADVRRKDVTFELTRRSIPGDSSWPSIETKTAYDASYGVGALFHKQSGDYLVRIKPILGFGLFDDKPGFAYIVQYLLAEVNHDLRFGGEIRGRSFTELEISIYLAKGFSLQDLAHLF